MQLSRRSLLTTFAVAAYAGSGLESRQRIERALTGKDVDRPPFSAWHHFHLEGQGPEVFARATVDFHRQTGTDLIKVMSDFPYLKGAGGITSLRPEANPFPAQIRALELIRDGVGSENYFVETIFNPWSVAEKLFSRDALLSLKREHPQQLLDALDVITRSEINHAHLALKTGARGIFLAIQNATPAVLSEADYANFSEPFDKQILAAASNAPLNVLHLHGDEIYWKRFTRGWATAAINYSSLATHVPISAVRAEFSGLLLSGIDEYHFPSLTTPQLKEQAQAARTEAGRAFILSPGCSVPDKTNTESISRLGRVFA